MRRHKSLLAAAVSLAATMVFNVRSAPAANSANLVRETLRQQSAAEQSGCAGVQRTMSGGADATLVVRTAVELGYNPCQVIRCALEAKATPGTDRLALCEKVVRGAVAAGVPSDVISRCATSVCDSSAVAAILAATMLEPNYCYFSPQPLVAPAPPPPPEPVFDRSLPRPQASPFTF